MRLIDPIAAMIPVNILYLFNNRRQQSAYL